MYSGQQCRNVTESQARVARGQRAAVSDSQLPQSPTLNCRNLRKVPKEQFRWPGESPSPATTASHLSQLVQRSTQAKVTRPRRSPLRPSAPPQPSYQLLSIVSSTSAVSLGLGHRWPQSRHAATRSTGYGHCRAATRDSELSSCRAADTHLVHALILPQLLSAVVCRYLRDLRLRDQRSPSSTICQPCCPMSGTSRRLMSPICSSSRTSS
jgi:hypothetical protein